MNPRKVWLHMRLLLSDPLELLDRVEVRLQERRYRSPRRDSDPRTAYSERVSFEEGIRRLATVFGRDASGILDEVEFHEIQTHIRTATAALAARGTLPYPTNFNADSTLALLAYLLCRMLEPETVVETGVANGATTAVILAALDKNRRGTLHSIDLPAIEYRASRAHIGILVPTRYRQRWHLQLGVSKRLLPRLLATSIPSVDLFIHDSANIDTVQRMELATAWRHMSPPSALIVNSIQGKVAFGEFVERENVGCWLAVEQREKRGHLTGVVVELSKPRFPI